MTLRLLRVSGGHWAVGTASTDMEGVPQSPRPRPGPPEGEEGKPEEAAQAERHDDDAHDVVQSFNMDYESSEYISRTSALPLALPLGAASLPE